MGWLRRTLQGLGVDAVPARPWYRRPDAWLALGVVLLPFGWVLALWRVAMVYATARRGPRP